MADDRPRTIAFARDRASAQAIAQGCPGTKVTRCGFNKALAHIGRGRPAARILIDVDGASSAAVAIGLAQITTTETAVIAIGGDDHADYTRALLHSGVADHLAKPITAAQIGRALAQATGHSMERAHAGRILALMHRGDAGAAGLAMLWAQHLEEQGHRVLVVDRGLAGGRVIDNSGEHIVQIETEPPVAGARITLRQRGEHNEPEDLAAALHTAANTHHAVIVLGVQTAEERESIANAADQITIICEPTIASAAHAAQLLGEEQRASVQLVVHRTSTHSGLSNADLRYALGRAPDEALGPKQGQRYRDGALRALDRAWEGAMQHSE